MLVDCGTWGGFPVHHRHHFPHHGGHKLAAHASGGHAAPVVNCLTPAGGGGILIDTIWGGSTNFTALHGGVLAVPEPSTWLLIAVGLVVIGLRLRRAK